MHFQSVSSSFCRGLHDLSSDGLLNSLVHHGYQSSTSGDIAWQSKQLKGLQLLSMICQSHVCPPAELAIPAILEAAVIHLAVNKHTDHCFDRGTARVQDARACPEWDGCIPTRPFCSGNWAKRQPCRKWVPSNQWIPTAIPACCNSNRAIKSTLSAAAAAAAS